MSKTNSALKGIILRWQHDGNDAVTQIWRHSPSTTVARRADHTSTPNSPCRLPSQIRNIPTPLK